MMKSEIKMMKSEISKNWYLLLIKGVIMILLAILVFNSPADALLTYVLYIGIGFIISGIVRIVQGISAKGTLNNWGLIVFEGLMDLFLGYILMAHPDLTLSLIPIMMGFWAAFYGLYLFMDAFSGNGNMLLKIIAGILIMLVGNIIIFNPISFGLSLVIWIGVLLLVAGIYNVTISFKIKALP